MTQKSLNHLNLSDNEIKSLFSTNFLPEVRPTNFNELLIKTAIKKDNLNFFQNLVQKNYDLNSSLSFLDLNPQGLKYNNLLTWACFEGSFNIVKFLVEQGADINCRTKEKETPLSLSALCIAKFAHAQIIAFLLKQGAKADTQNIIGLSPIHNYFLFEHHDLHEDSHNKLDISSYRFTKNLDHKTHFSNFCRLLELTPKEHVRMKIQKSNLLFYLTLQQEDSEYTSHLIDTCASTADIHLFQKTLQTNKKIFYDKERLREFEKQLAIQKEKNTLENMLQTVPIESTSTKSVYKI